MSKNSVEVLAANVMRLRTRNKWSIQDLAFYAKMSDKGVRNVEDCVHAASLVTIDKLAKSLKVTPAALLTLKK